MTSRCFSSRGCSTSSHCNASETYCALHLGAKSCDALWGPTSKIRPSQISAARKHNISRLRLLLAAAATVHRSNANGEEGSASLEAAASAKSKQLKDEQAVAKTKFVAETLLPTSSGKFRLRGYRHTVRAETVQSDGSVTLTEPSVIMTGQPEGQEEVVVRVHDACFTSEVLGSLKCDCADQLQLAMDYIQEHPGGLIIYLQQEGRGIGLANKIAAYALQEKGLDTVDANRELGLPDDAREYTSVLNILDDLGIKSIRLMTNNPRKIEGLRSLGVKVTERIPCIVKAQKHNLGYLSTKRSRMRHILSPESGLDGSYCIWNHDGEPLQATVFPPKTREQNGTPAVVMAERNGGSKSNSALEKAQKALEHRSEAES